MHPHFSIAINLRQRLIHTHDPSRVPAHVPPPTTRYGEPFNVIPINAQTPLCMFVGTNASFSIYSWSDEHRGFICLFHNSTHSDWWSPLLIKKAIFLSELSPLSQPRMWEKQAVAMTTNRETWKAGVTTTVAQLFTVGYILSLKRLSYIYDWDYTYTIFQEKI